MTPEQAEAVERLRKEWLLCSTNLCPIGWVLTSDMELILAALGIPLNEQPKEAT